MCCTVEFTGTNPIVFSNVLAPTASGHFVLMQHLRLISIGFTMCLHPLTATSVVKDSTCVIPLCGCQIRTVKERMSHLKGHVVEG